jgi:hypothetical protein
MSTPFARALHFLMSDLVGHTDAGLFCRVGDFHIDPWKPVERAVITHAHGDYARDSCKRYLAAADCRELLECRLGQIPRMFRWRRDKTAAQADTLELVKALLTDSNGPPA